MPVTYDQDVAAWATEEASLIRAGRFNQLDIEHIADEVEDVGRSERRELANRMAVLLAQLLKWKSQPTHRGGSRDRTIRAHRKQVLRKIKETPSLAPPAGRRGLGRGRVGRCSRPGNREDRSR